MNGFEFKGKYSQNGEEGIINEALKRIGITHGKCCEFGSADGYYCSNTRHLVDMGWDGLFMDKAHGHEITEENVNVLVPHDINVLSIDIDGNDFAIWMVYEGRPEIVIIEINSSIDPDREFFSPAKGASFKTMNRLAEGKGYKLIAHTGNCIYVLKEYAHLFPEEPKFKRDWLQ